MCHYGMQRDSFAAIINYRLISGNMIVRHPYKFKLLYVSYINSTNSTLEI
jgi:hypothetical protein